MATVDCVTELEVPLVAQSYYVLASWWHQVGAYDQFPLGIQPMFAGFLASAVPVLEGILVRRSR